MNKQAWIHKYGPWAVVTGASDGIGRAISIQLAEMGLNLVLVARRQAVLETLADEVNTRYGVEVQVIAADLSANDSVQTLINQTASSDVGLLVAAAGYGTSGGFIDLPLERELTMIDLNCRSVTALSHHFGARFAEQGHGGLILFSSLVAFQGVPRSASYAATKAYIQSFAEGLNHELAPSGVDVLASAPGPVSSGFAENADMQMGFALKPETVARSTLRALGRKANVRPGLLSKFLIGSLATLPRPLRVRAMKGIMGGMTAHQSQEPDTAVHQSA